MTVSTQLPVLELVKTVCRQLGILVPTGVYDSHDENALLMGSVINNIGALLSEHYKWQQFRAFFDVTGDGVESAFDVPVDYGRLVNNTGWSYAIGRPVYLVSAEQFNAALASKVVLSMAPALRLMGDQFVFVTPPAAGEKIRFEYCKKTWMKTTSGVPGEFCSANSDVPQYDWLLMVIALKLKWREAKGFDTAAESQDFIDRLNQVYIVDQPGQVLSLGGGGGVPLIGVQNLPHTGYGQP